MTKRSSTQLVPWCSTRPDLGAARPDFLDRALIVEFLDMKTEQRRDEAQFWREFEEVRPRILGALLDAATAGVRNLPNVKLDQLPRMADFALWVNACEESIGMKPGEPWLPTSTTAQRHTIWLLNPLRCTSLLSN